MPQDEQRKATGFEVCTFPENHKQLKSCYPMFGGSNYCARCYALAERDGEMGWYHQDGRDPSMPNHWVRKMPQPWEYDEDGLPLHHNIPHTTWGCSMCKVYRCKGCFRMEDEDGKPHPDAWDHRAPTRGLMRQSIVCE